MGSKSKERKKIKAITETVDIKLIAFSLTHFMVIMFMAGWGGSGGMEGYKEDRGEVFDSFERN